MLWVGLMVALTFVSFFFPNFGFLRNLYTDVHSGCINSHSYQQYIKIPFPPHSHLNWLPLDILVAAIFTGMAMHSLIAKYIGHFPFCLLAICSSFQMCLLKALAHL